jgi:arylsulfatase A-like enzyme
MRGIAALVGAGLVVGTACGRASRLDSVLLITLDTVRADHVSCYGPSPVATPHLDQVARQGALVERAWTPIPLTTPAHASILTGLYPPSHGVRSNARFRLPDGVTTLAEVLRDRGIKTAAFVASSMTSRLFGLDQGFETYDDSLGHSPDGERRTQRPGNEVVDRARAWIEANASEPFFLWVHLYDAHTPYEPPPEFARKHPHNPYAGEVAFVDLQVGRLIVALQEARATRRTVIAIISDHGEGLETHGEPEHGFLLYEESLRIPFLLVALGHIPSGTRIHELASAVDVVPTVLGLLGVPVPSGLHGIDLLATDEPRRGGLYAETLYPFEEFGWSAIYAYRQGDHKVIEAPRIEMYDVASDPGERHDLSATRKDEALGMVAELRGMAAQLVDADWLAQAVGLGQEDILDPEHLKQLESLGYVGGGGNVNAGEAQALPSVGGRNPMDATADLRRYKHAEQLLHLGQHDEAGAVFADLRRTDPGNPQVLLKLAQSRQRSGRGAEAEELYRDLVRAHPTFYLGYWSFCDYLQKAGRAREARDLWLRLKALVPGYVGIEIGIARAETAAGLASEAKGRLEAYLRERPEDAPAWRELGRARHKLGDARGAVEAYRRALDLHPTDGDALDEAVALLGASGRAREAAALVSQLLDRAPEDPRLRRKWAELVPPR